MRVASIDIGTNTLRLLICEPEARGSIRSLFIDLVITRLGEGVNPEEGILQPGAMDRTLDVLKRFSKIIEDYGAQRVRAVATSVVRSSQNGAEYVNRIESETGIHVEIISGDQEARLTTDGVLKAVEAGSSDCLIIDIGGGSTEFIRTSNGSITVLKSLNLGVVHLTEEFLCSGNDTLQELQALSKSIQIALAGELVDFTKADGDIVIIATAGTPTTLAAIDLNLTAYDPPRVNGHILSRAGISQIINLIASTPRGLRSGINGLEKGREDIIIAGGYILLDTLEILSCDKVVVSDGGLLEGVAYGLIN